MLLVASFRTNVVVVTALVVLLATFVVLGAGQYETHAVTDGLIKTAGWLGLLAAALAICLACAEVCDFTYGRTVLPIGPPARK
jgi:uncharacterized protein